MRETWVQSLGWKDPLEKGKATHSSILVRRIPWTIQSVGSQRVEHDRATFTTRPLSEKGHTSEVWERKRRRQKAYVFCLFPDTLHSMDPYRGTLERCTVRRCSVPGWPVPSLSVPTPLTAASSVQVRGTRALRPQAGQMRLFSALSWVGGMCGEGISFEGGWKGCLS